MRYHHEQRSAWAPALFAVIAVGFTIGMIRARPGIGTLLAFTAILVLVEAMILVFSRLTVTVNDDEVVLAFGWGWPARSFALADIATIDVARNRWYYGFGIRLTPHGWMYNVWGLDAVQLNLRAGNAFRIGTDEPDELAAALRAELPDAR